MATKGEHVKNKELNFILKCIGERGNEDEKLKVYTENVIFHALQQLSNASSQNGIMFRACGSAAEDLKCIEPNDLGDVDIVIFPNSDNLIIHEEMIEYLPENPMHVRIKGAHHPVLQSCLVEGTEYVATSALKNFHPAIYENSMHLFEDLASFATQVMSRKECSAIIQSIYHFKNNTNSPAATINLERSFDSFMKGVKMLSNGKNLAFLDPTSWEWFAYRLCTARQSDFARAYTEVANELLDFAKDVGNSFQLDASIFPGMLQTSFSLKQDSLKTRVNEIELPSQPGDTREMENWSDEESVHNQQNVLPRGREECSQRMLPWLPSESSYNILIAVSLQTCHSSHGNGKRGILRRTLFNPQPTQRWLYKKLN